MKKSLTQNVCEMKALAEHLVPYTHPLIPYKREQEILVLKQRTVNVNGIDVNTAYSKADYGDHFMESVQIQGAYSVFLPFNLVCKIGRAFLGDKNLSYIGFFKNNVRKVYCWITKSREGRLLPPDNTSEPGSYEGFEFHILKPGTVDLF